MILLVTSRTKFVTPLSLLQNTVPLKRPGINFTDINKIEISLNKANL